MQKIKLKIWRRGESLVETLVAIFILALGATGSLALIMSSIQTTEKIEDRVLATNLAREGLEGVRVVRDTNWLEYAGERRDYWNCVDSECNKNILENRKYLVDFDEDFRWQLYPLEEDADLDLSDASTDLVNDFLLVLKEENGGRFYTHNKGENGTDCLSDPECEQSIFYRWVEFEYEDEGMDGNGIDDVLKATVTVQWIDSVTDRVLEVKLITYLTDYLGRGISDLE
jgi:type II secretory pathway pseudopilin PulG